MAAQERASARSGEGCEGAQRGIELPSCLMYTSARGPATTAELRPPLSADEAPRLAGFADPLCSVPKQLDIAFRRTRAAWNPLS
jgi:hypothetical protein